MSNSETAPKFGHADASYQAAGGINGLRKLVDEFYRNMETLPVAKGILGMHPKDLDVSRDKLTLFLSGWLGGPRLYSEKYGVISIPGAHQHLPVGEDEKFAWLECMRRAIAVQSYSSEFSEYLIAALSVPANRVQSVCNRQMSE